MQRKTAWMMSLLVTISFATLAEEAATPAEIFAVEEVVIEPGNAYPAELASAGVQGEALVRATIGPDRRLVEPTIATSSKSDQLDELALRYVARLRLNGDIQPGSQEVLVPLVFTRDTVFTIKKKSCAEFLADLAYARGVDPAATSKGLRSYKLATGLVMFAEKRPPKELNALAKNLKDAPQIAEARCAESPEKNFLQTLSAVLLAR